MAETRIVLRNCEVIDPRDINTHLAGDGFKALATPVLDTLKYFRNDYENRIKQSVFLRALRGLE